ncbi:protein-lysine N-methyltransferase mettl10 [Plakobranchus ocellatus]|uniref:Protein-lysine N-methyltransferase PoB_003396400 n=1 Tax=Plakobranchus ocellatus TaxID=259542 RepID=A0AAV4AIE1_9GAST|nr:protein-lysine N-methyltransferase mettl10 [Plakobranchus ocellatus]
MSEEEGDFHSSQLGSKEYWDAAYNRELKAFTDIGDVGEIWFGEDVQNRMVRWVSQRSDLLHSARVLDLGCGNGTMLLELHEEDFMDLTGVDYSEAAIQLATDVAAKAGVTDISFEVCDILNEESVSNLIQEGKDKFDICLDKGTYDAISLHDPSDPTDRRLYATHVHSLLTDQGRLIITSCNWTKDQLVLHFEKEFELVHELPAPSFTFGGKKGQTVTTLIFRKKTLDAG